MSDSIVARVLQTRQAVVVSDASTGRILTVVGQKTAYKDGYQPCSTIKVPVALAALIQEKDRMRGKGERVR